MNRLPLYAKELLLQGAKMTGTYTEGYYAVEEEILAADAVPLLAFTKWIDTHIGGAADGNIDMLYLAYKNPFSMEYASKAKALAEKIQRIKSL